MMRKQPARGRDVATRTGRGFAMNTSTGGGVCREFVRQRTRPHTQLEGRGVAQPTVGRDLPYLGGRGVARFARGGSGPARAGVRGHGGVGCGGKRCLKRVSKGRRGLAGNLAWQGVGLEELGA